MKRIPTLSDAQKQRIWSAIDRGAEGDCWLWMHSTNNRGYGQVGIGNNDNYLAHRVIYFIATGKQPGRLKVLHSCDTPRCCNPNHLFLGTQRVNVLDMAAKGRDTKALGVDNGRAKLTPESVRMIRTSTLSERALARVLGVSRTPIGQVRREETWRHVT
jgi:hypothetical protein